MLKGKANGNKIITNKAAAATFVYSISKINEKYIELYSVIKPATNSDSDSGKSKGIRLSSAKMHIKLIAKNA